jgi:homoserine kinase
MTTHEGAPPMSMTVRVPASSANLGAGFDALGLAVTLWADVGTGPPLAGAHVADEHHPASVAHRAAGGTGVVWVRSPIPMGRGLGYSGAVRVGGAVAGVAERRPDDIGADGHLTHDAAAEALAIAARLEGHADNAAASLHGGVIVTTGDRTVQVPLALDPAVVVWIPGVATSTDRSRATLPGSVPFEDAVFNVSRAALFVAALASGDVDSLRDATADRLHQQVRLADVPGSAAALDAGLDAGAWCGWLSGSGPTVAFLTSVGDAATLVARLPGDGHSKVLGIDHDGAVVRTTR